MSIIKMEAISSLQMPGGDQTHEELVISGGFVENTLYTFFQTFQVSHNMRESHSHLLFMFSR